MIRRVFWISVGVGATIYVLRKANRATAAVSRFTPDGVASAVNSLADSLRDFTSEFTASMAQHEETLLEALTSETDPRPAPSAWDSEFDFDEGDPEEYF